MMVSHMLQSRCAPRRVPTHILCFNTLESNQRNCSITLAFVPRPFSTDGICNLCVRHANNVTVVLPWPLMDGLKKGDCTLTIVALDAAM